MNDSGSGRGKQPARENLWKIVINGNAGIGKSSLLVRFTEGIFEEQKMVTLDSEYKVKELKQFENTGKDIRLQIFDTSGQEKFRTITSSYYRGAAGSLLVYDMTNKASFDALTGWFEDINRYLPDVPRIVVANKLDLEKNRVISTAQGEELAKKANAPFFETSAKVGDNVDEVFYTLTRMIHEEEIKQAKSRQPHGVDITTKRAPQPKAKKGFCCLI